MKLLLLISAALATLACGGTPPGTQTAWACYNSGSAQRQALGPAPHQPDFKESNWSYCTDDDFKEAGWMRDANAPGGWRPPPHVEAIHPPVRVNCMASCQQVPVKPVPSCRFKPCTQEPQR